MSAEIASGLTEKDIQDLMGIVSETASNVTTQNENNAYFDYDYEDLINKVLSWCNSDNVVKSDIGLAFLERFNGLKMLRIAELPFVQENEYSIAEEYILDGIEGDISMAIEGEPLGYMAGMLSSIDDVITVVAPVNGYEASKTALALVDALYANYALLHNIAEDEDYAEEEVSLFRRLYNLGVFAAGEDWKLK
jgi:hypothetical protein